MKSFAILALAAVGMAKQCRDCLTKADVEELSQAYTRLVGAFDEADMKYLSDDWIDISQSINSFIKPDAVVEADPVAVTFNKAEFQASQLQLPPGLTPIVLVDEPLRACNRFAIEWTSTFGVPIPGVEPNIVRGISIIKGKHVKDSHPIMTQWDVEFNSLAWAKNLGGSYCLNNPSAEGPAPRIEGNPVCAAPPVASLV